MFYQVSQEQAYVICGALADRAAAVERSLLDCPPDCHDAFMKELVMCMELRDLFYDDGMPTI